MRFRICACLLALLLLTGCGREKTVVTASGQNGENETVATVSTQPVFTDRDYEVGYDQRESVTVTLQESTASTNGRGVKIEGSTVTITEEGTYVLTGNLEDGMVIVDIGKEEKVQLVLSGVSIHSKTSAPIYIRQADKVFLTTEADTENTLSNGGAFQSIDENNIDAALFSKEDLTLNGSGSLVIQSPAGHGIVSKDELSITSGSYQITASSHGISGKDNVCVANAAVDIHAGKDGIQAENEEDTALGFVYIESGSFSITAEGDGISASSYLHVLGGSFDMVTGGGSVNASGQSAQYWGGFGGYDGFVEENGTSSKGMKAATEMILQGGSFTLDAADDAVHSNGDLTVSGGSFQLSTGDDGFHADNALVIAGGDIRISESYEGLEGLTIDVQDGVMEIYADDDGLNAAGGNDQSGFGGPRGGDMFGSTNSASFINIFGGSLYINAGGDGLDSNGSVTLSGGSVCVSGAVSGDTAILDYATSGRVTGGIFIATGASQMNVNFSNAENQGVIMVSTGNQSAGTVVSLKDAQGNVILNREADQAFSCVMISCPAITQGQTYTLTVGGSAYEITMSSLIYGSGGMGGFGGGGMGGFGGGGMGGPGGGGFGGKRP